MGFIGVLFVIGLNTFTKGVGDLLPQLAIIIAAASYVISGAMVKRLKGMSSAMVAAGVLLGGCLLTLPASLLLENPLASRVPACLSSAIIALVYLGLIPYRRRFFCALLPDTACTATPSLPKWGI